MTLKERLQQDLHQALRDGDAPRKSAIRLVRAAVINEEIARQHQLDDEGVLEILRREIKQHRESLSEFEKAGRTDLIAEEKAQLQALLAYLPAQMNREEIALAAQQAISETNAAGSQDLGQVMRLLMPRVKGKADGQMVNQVVRELLSSLGPGET
ncbi:MAG: GatB/YqeY domain-containing protein [Chloroflexi bacterium]|nr:GatB/YqeY domain-containing protein [Chloroflexota bacterium]